MSLKKAKNNGLKMESLLAILVEKSVMSNVEISNTNVYLLYTNLKIMNKYILRTVSHIHIPIFFTD
jgi:hypothetical protein